MKIHSRGKKLQGEKKTNKFPTKLTETKIQENSLKRWNLYFIGVLITFRGKYLKTAQRFCVNRSKSARAIWRWLTLPLKIFYTEVISFHFSYFPKEAVWTICRFHCRRRIFQSDHVAPHTFFFRELAFHVFAFFLSCNTKKKNYFLFSQSLEWSASAHHNHPTRSRFKSTLKTRLVVQHTIMNN